MCITEQNLLIIRIKNLDVDKLVGQLVNQTQKRVSINSKADPAKESEAKVTRLLQLRTLLHAFPALRSALRNSTSLLLKDIAISITDDRTDEMLEIISKSINEDAISSLQKGQMASRNARIYAIRAERKLLLDVARETCSFFLISSSNRC